MRFGPLEWYPEISDPAKGNEGPRVPKAGTWASEVCGR